MIPVGSIHRGRTFKSITVAGIGEHDMREEIIDFAIAALGETRSSLFGWDIRHHIDCEALATVTVYTD